MRARKSVPDEFGIIVPEDNGIHWVKQAGGFSCTQHIMEGVYLPLGKLKYNLGYPSWVPDSVNHKDYIMNITPSKIPERKMPEFPEQVFEQDGFKSVEMCHKWVEDSNFDGATDLFDFIYSIEKHPDKPSFENRILSLDMQKIPKSDFETLPERVKQDGFSSSKEYMNWVQRSEKYGWIKLWDDAYRFTYGVFENLDSDPRDRWHSSDELWEEINSYFPFNYETLDYEESREYDIPLSPPAIQPVRITSTDDPEYRLGTDFSGLEDTVVILLGPNAD